jgi:hypothetical protein
MLLYRDEGWIADIIYLENNVLTPRGEMRRLKSCRPSGLQNEKMRKPYHSGWLKQAAMNFRKPREDA